MTKTEFGKLLVYRKFIFQDHEVIKMAIARGDPKVAGSSMRNHLKGDQLRYRELLIGGRSDDREASGND